VPVLRQLRASIDKGEYGLHAGFAAGDFAALCNLRLGRCAPAAGLGGAFGGAPPPPRSPVLASLALYLLCAGPLCREASRARPYNLDLSSSSPSIVVFRRASGMAMGTVFQILLSALWKGYRCQERSVAFCGRLVVGGFYLALVRWAWPRVTTVSYAPGLFRFSPHCLAGDLRDWALCENRWRTILGRLVANARI